MSRGPGTVPTSYKYRAACECSLDMNNVRTTDCLYYSTADIIRFIYMILLSIVQQVNTLTCTCGKMTAAVVRGFGGSGPKMQVLLVLLLLLYIIETNNTRQHMPSYSRVEHGMKLYTQQECACTAVLVRKSWSVGHGALQLQLYACVQSESTSKLWYTTTAVCITIQA